MLLTQTWHKAASEQVLQQKTFHNDNPSIQSILSITLSLRVQTEGYGWWPGQTWV